MIFNLLNNALWVAAGVDAEAPVIERKFKASGAARANIALSSLGFFKLFINGEHVGNEYFLPSNSIYCKRDFKKITYPIKDEFTYRAYFSEYDISDYLKDGENLLEIKLGGGWYRQTERVAEGNMSFGDSLAAIYSIKIKDSDGERHIVSDGTELYRESETVYSNLFIGEVIDARRRPGKAFPVSIIKLASLLTAEDAPPDRAIRKITPQLIYDSGEKRIYDAGENISGIAAVKLPPVKDASVRLRFSESLKGCELDFFSTGSNYICTSGRPQIQEDRFITDGERLEFEPEFVWHAFRYIEAVGDITDITVKVIHSDIKVSGEFRSSSPELNWLHEAYIRTQLDNMHGGVPSDCPHRERLGYTGDGQVSAPAAMLSLDARAFYKKWIRDIFDSQDKSGGHINHTAPFAGGGGGPGGWGMAAITVPYNYYKIYGDLSPAREHFERMRLWVDYLVSRSESGLIVREEPRGWCLGDWLTPEKCIIPEPLVNTCLFIRALHMIEELAEALGSDGKYFEHIRAAAEDGVIRTYYNPKNGSFADGVQGADAYALYARLGNTATAEALKAKYSSLEAFDTGFIGTDILCEVLFTLNEQDTAFRLITSHAPGGYGYFMDRGLTTLPESWRMEASLCHPMFGAPVRLLYTGILGISIMDAVNGRIKISPKIPSQIEWASGKIRIKCGDVCVYFKKDGRATEFAITLPKLTEALFEYNGITKELGAGTNEITVYE